MDKKEALLRSLVELKAAHDKAGAALAVVMNVAAQAAKGQDTVPTIADIRRYKKAIVAAKVHATQTEMVLIEYAVPRLAPDDLNAQPVYLQ